MIRLLIMCLLGLVALRSAKMADWWAKCISFTHPNKILGAEIVADTDFLSGKEKRGGEQNPGVCYENVLLPYDKGGILYLPQSMGTDGWTGELSALADSYDIYVMADDYWGRKQDAIAENHAFVLWLAGADYYYEMRLIVTGTPVVSIQTSHSGEAGLSYGEIEVFNPCRNTTQYEILQAYVRYHQKGANSAGFAKKSYSISIRDYKGRDVDVPLLGMRADNSWKLNALFNDPNRIREITACQIWEQFDKAETSLNEAGPRMEYVELVLDNCYQGLYGLVEPVDRKKLGLDANDVLYKTVSWKVPSEEEFQMAIDEGADIMNPFRIKYPKTIADYNAAWSPMRDYIHTFFRGEFDCSYDDMLQKVNLTNVFDIFLFSMAVSASDNHYKNLFYAARVDLDGQYVMYQIPWDLDLTFGNLYNAGAHNGAAFMPDSQFYGIENAASAIVGLNYTEMRAYLGNCWRRYREDFLNTEAVLGLLADNRDYLVWSGAAIREQERWPEEPVSMDIGDLLDFQTKRLEWLDENFMTVP